MNECLITSCEKIVVARLMRLSFVNSLKKLISKISIAIVFTNYKSLSSSLFERDLIRFFNSFFSRFPRLLIHSHIAMQDYKSENIFSEFYDQNADWDAA